MKCDEELLALHAGGDLTDLEAAAVAGHVAECPACRRLLAEFQALRGDVRALGDEELASVWPAVRDAIEPRRWRIWPWAMPVAVAASLVILFLPRDRAVSPPAAPTPPAPPGAVAVARAAPVLRRPRGRTALPAGAGTIAAAAAKNPEALVVKLVTDDQSVVIYWLIDGTKGD